MSSRKPVTDDELSEYVDGGLSEERRAEIAAWLLENPKKAAEVERLRQLNDALRDLGADILDEPVPERLREVVRRARSGSQSGARDKSGDEPAGRQAFRRRSGSGTVEVVAAFAIFALGGALGWGVHQTLVEDPSGVEHVVVDARDGALTRSVARLLG